jgi:intein/homing endonuclease
VAGKIVSATHWQTETGEHLPYVVDDKGVPRVLARLRPRADFGRMKSWRATQPVIPRDQWVECDYSHFNAPILDQGQHGSCFPAGTMVRLADGKQCPIDRIRLLDRVVTAEGNVGRVTDLMVRTDRNELIGIYLWGHRHLKSTPEHPILTERGYVPAAELTAGDWVAMPKYLPKWIEVIQTADHVAFSRWSRNEDKASTYSGVRGRKGLIALTKKLPDTIRLTPGFGRILGLFVAEGSCDSAKIVWTFHKDEADTLAAELVGLLASELGIEANLTVNDARNTTMVVVYGTAWSRLFESLCGTGSASKRLDRDVTQGPEEFLSAVVSGWFDGDGYSRRGRCQVPTVSRSLALGMFDILNAIGHAPSIRRSEPALSHGVKHREVRWDVDWAEEYIPTYRCRQDDKHVWRRVVGTERMEFAGPVFNMEVSGDNSYVAEGIGVHNCVGHGSVTAFTRAWSITGHPIRKFSSCYIYGNINGGRDQGAIVSDAMDLLLSKGTCLESTVPEGMIFRRQFPAGADAEAQKYRAFDCYHLGSFDEIGSALVMGDPVCFGIMVGARFNNLDSEGVPPVGGNGGHCLEGHGLVRLKSGKWGVRTQNSWSVDWGNGGCCVLIEGHFTYGQNYMGGLDAFAIRATADAPDDER